MHTVCMHQGAVVPLMTPTGENSFGWRFRLDYVHNCFYLIKLRVATAPCIIPVVRSGLGHAVLGLGPTVPVVPAH
jgi:hypothetical protein